jgi:hypothetical protein
MKPTQEEVNRLIDTYASNNIIAHFDIGQLDGGNEVPFNKDIWLTAPYNGQSYAGENGLIDFYDYKRGGDSIASQFNLSRYKIFRYMLVGYNFQTLDENGNVHSTASGGAWAGDDDIFVSYGMLKESEDLNISEQDLSMALSGTMIHELGHSLCLTKPKYDDTSGQIPAYNNQPLDCQFAGIDSPNASTSYESSLNYNFQFSLVDYSHGVNGVDDHNDWLAIRPQDFQALETGDEYYQSFNMQGMMLQPPLQQQGDRQILEFD